MPDESTATAIVAEVEAEDVVVVEAVPDNSLLHDPNVIASEAPNKITRHFLNGFFIKDHLNE
jgi:hypothetical protein